MRVIWAASGMAGRRRPVLPSQADSSAWPITSSRLARSFVE
jgi:hypothetical protein